MNFKKLLALLLCISVIAATFFAVTANAASICTITKVFASHSSSDEVVNCIVKYSGSFQTAQNYVFLLTDNKGRIITNRTATGTALNAADGSFSYSFNLANSAVNSASKPLTLTVRSTNSTIISSYDQEVALVDSNPTVSFVGHEGVLLSEQTVIYGADAVAPVAPEVENYTFNGWDKSFNEVTESITVNALYVSDSTTESSEIEPSESNDETESTESGEISEDSFILGDVNMDGSTDNLDAAYVLRYDAMLLELNALQLKAADANNDGSVDSLDAAQILKHDAGLIDLFQ